VGTEAVKVQVWQRQLAVIVVDDMIGDSQANFSVFWNESSTAESCLKL